MSITKSQMLAHIEKVHIGFYSARNHGRNGGNWWYPTPYVIAYNVKMNSFPSVDEFRKYLTPKQNEYYSDEYLTQVFWREQEDACEGLVEDIQHEFNLKSWFAGRSGGWIEVQYDSCDLDSVDASSSYDEIKATYKDARELERLSSRVQKCIEDAHKAYNKYVDSETYYKELLEELLTDSEIDAEYLERIESLKAKIG